MIRKSISIIIYILVGLFFSSAGSILFVAGHQPLPFSIKLGFAAFLFIAGLILFFIGVLFSGLKNWLRDLGVLLIIVAVLQAFTIMTFACMFVSMYLTPDLQSIITNDWYPNSQNSLFLGAGYIIFEGAVGVLLVRHYKQKKL